MSLSDYASAITHWRADPVGWTIDVVGFKPKTWQSVGLTTLADPDTDRLAIRACQGPGKTTIDALAVIWFLSCFYPCKVPCTAPSQHQLADNLWPEIKKWLEHSKTARHGIDLESIFEWTKEKVSLRENPERCFAVRRTASVRQTISGPESIGLQGFHDDNLLFIIDEASGVHQAVYDVAEGARSTGDVVKMLATGNPNIPAGWFYEAFQKNSSMWRTMRIHWQNGGINQIWAEQMIREVGIDSPFVRVRVLGMFPRGVTGALISLDDWTECIGKSKREEVLALHPGAKRVLGVDVAGGGNNQTIATLAQGNCILKIKRIDQYKQPAIAAEVIAEVDRTKSEIVVIDCDGGYGAGVCDIVDEYYAGKRNSPELVRWHGNAAARNDDEFHNKRAEIAWAMKMAAESGTLSVRNNSRLTAQATQILYEHKNLKGKNAIILEKKSEFQKRMEKHGGSASPDEYDSATYALAPSLLGHASVPCVELPERDDRYHMLIQ